MFVEINYKIHHRELLAIVNSFQEWQHFSEGIQSIVTNNSDQENFEYF